jgi:precorrin-2 methylase
VDRLRDCNQQVADRARPAPTGSFFIAGNAKLYSTFVFLGSALLSDEFYIRKGVISLLVQTVVEATARAGQPKGLKSSAQSARFHPHAAPTIADDRQP